MNKRKGLGIMAIVAAATVGEGVFALPYVIQTAGWLLTLCYFVALIAAVSVAHIIYLRTLAAVDEKERLLGLAGKYFGGTGFWIGFVAIVVGMLLGFVAYLVLGMHFLQILFPGISPVVALGVFWFLLACLVWGSEGKVARLEIAGIALIACAILFIFFSGRPDLAFANMPLAITNNFFLPFGAVLFSLAGWTSVEQVYELTRSDPKAKNNNLGAFVAGVAFAAALYWLFALGVIGSVSHVASDTISGIGGWPVWRKDVLAVVGLASVCVVSVPLAREMRGAMEKDLKWNSLVSRAIIVGLPLAVVLSGFTNFLVIVSVAGGVFISTQYLLIISVGRRTLALTSREKLLLDIVTIVFVCAAVYEVASFVVH
ncbi:MAG: aromatic amino acid transport family protein [Candidatus Pacebacteria bacterium]|nr:aromatic amino acid transport family protein [Candidatus Paceibacterota bacterium]